MTITWIIRLGHFNILLCETNMDNVKEYVIHPKDSFKHRSIGQQRLVLFRRQKRKPQAYPNRDIVQKVMPGSKSSMERSLLPLPIRKWRECKKFVNSGKACCTEICYLELCKGRSRGVGACCWVLLFSGDSCIPSHSHSISFLADWTPSKLEEAAKDQECPQGEHCSTPQSPTASALH